MATNLKGYKITIIPEGILSLDELKPKKTKLKKKIKPRPKINLKTASIKDVAIALGKNYSIEKDGMKGVRHWIITSKKSKKEFRIRYVKPLMFAIDFIERNGAQKFIKDFEFKERNERR